MLRSLLQKNKFLLLKIFSLFIAIASLELFPSLNESINYASESFIKKISAEKLPDSSIILIKITNEDIDKIGPWPIKRSYYALLIRKLKSLGVQKIGLEVFLSARITSQTIYDNLLESEISRAGNVVLSSVAGEIYLRRGNYYTDSLSFPTPKLLNESIETGHINFLGFKEFIVPSELISFNQTEKAFALKLSDKPSKDNKLIINFVSSWNKFKSYSMLDFFELLNQGESAEKIFKNKIVLIGVTDNQIAPQLSSPFDDELPGLALHTFATDNLLSNRYFKDDFKTISAIVFVILLLLLISLTEKYKEQLTIIFILFFIGIAILVFVLQEVLYMKSNTSYYMLGFTLVLFTQLIQLYFESREQLNVSETEKEFLKLLLQKKEEELASLKKQSESLRRDQSDNLKIEIEKLQDEIKRLQENREDLAGADDLKTSDAQLFFGIAYKSEQMNNVVELIKKAAPTDSTIFITGESGTGKELVANAIHKLSKRASENFVVVNCAALTESLLESELFGHVKGAFTGAVSDKQGKFEFADKGTIFLDEIGETSENFQVKLLRVLQSGDIEKVGATTSRKVNVRVIAATNRNPEQLVSEKKFREDLYYRINVININIPPLRERKEDIDVIVDYLLKQAEQNVNISIAALKALNEYDWRGNVRELESVIKRAIIFASSEGRNIIQLRDLPESITKSVKTNIEDLVIESLRQKKFSHSAISETAKELGNINRTVVAENFRGYSFKLFVENDFDKEVTLRQIAKTDDDEILRRVEQKFNLWIDNIKSDINSFSSEDFEKIKSKFSSKYKNLPQRFHLYLDEVIKYLLSIKS